MLTRRQLLSRTAAGGAGLMLPGALLRAGEARAAAPTLQLSAYRHPLQVPPVARAGVFNPGAPYALDQVATTKVLHPSLAANGTNVWSYHGEIAADGPAIGNPTAGYGGFLGPTVVVQKGTGLDLSFTNRLGRTTYPGWVPVDLNFTPGNKDEIRPMTHLHGGFVVGQYDGNPAVDMGYGLGETQRLWYPNAQRATLLWYHDHGHGTTRLNVFAGLAGGYVIRDEYDTGTADNANGLPVGYGTGPGNYELPLVVQDRQFSSTASDGVGVGDWLYPRTPQVAGGAGSFGRCGNAPNQYGAAPGPWIGEYFGDEFLANGMVAPFVNVEPRVYRLRVINGCNGRFLNLGFLDR